MIKLLIFLIHIFITMIVMETERKRMVQLTDIDVLSKKGIIGHEI